MNYYLNKKNFHSFLDSLNKNYAVFIPEKKFDAWHFASYNPSKEKNAGDQEGTLLNPLGDVRSTEPLKAFFLKARELVSSGYDDDVPLSKNKPFCIVGAKACA